MKPDLLPYIGRTVSVTVDRPLGSRHPACDTVWYPLNYGYLPNTVSGDNEPIDVYLLGVYEPVRNFEAVVIGVVIRSNDEEDKLVAAPKGKVFSVEQIAALVEFQERFFVSKVEV